MSWEDKYIIAYLGGLHYLLQNVNKGKQVFVVLLFKLKELFRPPSYYHFCVSS